jgi:hypothetical protein
LSSYFAKERGEDEHFNGLHREERRRKRGEEELNGRKKREK